MAVIIVVLIVLVAYFISQNRALKLALKTKSALDNKDSTIIAISDDVYEDPDNIKSKAEDQNLYHDFKIYETTYTALNTAKIDGEEDHPYMHYK